MKSPLTWTAYSPFPDVTEARCGTRLIGSYQEFPSGRFRWEIIPAFNADHRFVDDSRGRAENATSAKEEIEKRFVAWLAETPLRIAA